MSIPSTHILYGIPNCDSVKKAKKWLDDNHINYEFYNFKKQPLNPIQIKMWFKQLGYEALINKRSTTWRNLPDETKQTFDELIALAVIEDQPTIIKRPILETANQTLIGFSVEQYTSLFKPVK